MADRDTAGRRTLRERVLGDRERLGWWTLPAFLVVGLAGAVLAGSFVVVWQTQKIQALRDEVQDARAELADAVDRVREAGDEALDAIASQVQDVEAVVNAGLPVESALDIGVAVLRVDAPVAESRALGFVGAQEQPSDQPTSPQDPGPAPAQESEQPAPEQRFEARVGSAVAVAVDGATTFFATSYALVADPRNPGGVLDRLSLDAGRGRVPAVVHSWDERRDLALVRAEVGSISLPRWRPFDQPVAVGDRTFVVGLTSVTETVQQPGAVTFVDVNALLTDHDVVGTLRGAPVVDAAGRLVGIASADYRPFPDDDRAANIPVRLLCESLLRSCDQLQASDEPTEGDG